MVKRYDPPRYIGPSHCRQVYSNMVMLHAPHEECTNWQVDGEGNTLATSRCRNCGSYLLAFWLEETGVLGDFIEIYVIREQEDVADIVSNSVRINSNI